MDNGHLPQRGEPQRQSPATGNPSSALAPQGNVLQMDTDKFVLHPNEKRYIAINVTA